MVSRDLIMSIETQDAIYRTLSQLVKSTLVNCLLRCIKPKWCVVKMKHTVEFCFRGAPIAIMALCFRAEVE